MGALIEVDDLQLSGAPAATIFAPNLLAPDESWFLDFPDWFDETDDDGNLRVPLNKLWIDSEGRAAGRTFGPTCLLDGNEGECWIPPKSPTNYEAFHQGAQPFLRSRGAAMTVTVKEVGIIAGRNGHAPDHLTFAQAQMLYANAKDQYLIGRAFDREEDDGVHGYFLGAVLPDVTVESVARVRRSAVSCDWRYRHRDNAGRPLNRYDNLGPLLVTRPGLPLDRRGMQHAPRMRARAASVTVGTTAIPQGYTLVLDESETPMFCSTCGRSLDDGHTHADDGAVLTAPCSCQTAHTAAVANTPPPDILTPTGPPPSGSAILTDTVTRAEFDALTQQVNELAAAVAEMMVDGMDVGDLMDCGPMTAAVSGSSGLPLADRGRAWDGSAAEANVKTWATDPKGNLDLGKFGRAFLWHAPAPTEQGDFKLPFADVINGTLTAVPHGLMAAAGVMQGAMGGVKGMSDADRASVKGRIAGYYKSMGMPVPWKS